MSAGIDPGAALLVLNAGSSSLKWALFDASLGRLEGGAMATPADPDEVAAAVERALTLALAVGRPVAAVGHRVVHGGARFAGPVLLDDAVRQEIAALAPLAPLHNPRALAGVAAVAARLPGVPQVASFDTAFHATMPEAARRWAIPWEWQERWGIRRFGFHGLSHAWASRRARAVLGGRSGLRLVTCHLGAGCSLAAVRDGRSLATTMGFTPLDGLVMATRPGALDPGVVLFLLQEAGLPPAEIADALAHRSGLAAIAGSGDMRDVLRLRAAGDPRAALAFDLFVWRLRAEIAAMAAALEGIDALVFTGGIGEHQPPVRLAACAGLGWLGVDLDLARNGVARPDADVATDASPARVLVVASDEERVVAEETLGVLHERPARA